MTLLSPIAAIVAGALAGPVLLLYYFLRLRRQPIRVSSTLLWYQATRDLQVNVPWRMIRPTWLLVLQMIGLALLAAALGRPAINMAEAPSSRVVVIVDASASMGARDGPEGATRLDAAKSRAREIIDRSDRLGTSSRVMVIVLAAQARAVTGFTMDRGALRSAVEQIEQTDQPGNLRAALELATASIAGEGDEDFRPEPADVFILSDGVFAEPTRGLAVPGARVRYEAMGEVRDTPGRDNLGIVALSARRDYDDPGLVRIFARVLSALEEESAETLILALDGIEVERRAVLVPGRDSRGEPGQTSATFVLAAPGGGVATVVLGGRDILSADNAAGVVLRAATRPRILVVARDGDGVLESPARGPNVLLLDAVRELDAASLRAVGESTYASLSREGVLEHDVVIFAGVVSGEPPLRPSLHFGPIAMIEGVTQGPVSAATRFTVWERTHPVLRDVTLDGVVVAQPRPMTVAEGARATELAAGREGSLIVWAEDRFARRILVGFDLAQSTWPVHFGFPIFLSNAIEYLATGATGDAGESVRTDAPAEVRVSAGVREFHVVWPTGERTPVRAGGSADVGGLVRVPLGLLPRAGVYRIEGAGPGGDTALVVNLLDETESQAAVAESLEIGGEVLRASAGAREATEIWPWFVLAALVVLGLEWFLSAAMMRT